MAKQDRGIFVKQIGTVSEIFPKKRIKDRVVIGEDITKVDGKEQKIIFESVRIAIKGMHYDFDSAILARNERGRVLGYILMFDYSHFYEYIEPEFMELHDLKVDPGRFRKGIGRNLILFAQLCAVLRGKKLIVRPERASKGAHDKRRNVIAPVSTKDLIEMYKKLGFREFTEKEIGELAKKEAEEELDRRMLSAGYGPDTLELGYKKSPITREDHEKMKKIPFEERLRTCQRTKELGGSGIRSEYKDWVESNRRLIETHLVFDGGMPWQNARKLKKIGKRKPVYWNRPRKRKPRPKREEKVEREPEWESMDAHI